ncbi:MAG: MFS transporter [Deltaproteobacteria bacterium]|nr:MFS transporter [Deltaproteobacteria bacterium]
MTDLSRRGAWMVAICATLTMTVSYIDRATLGVLAPSVTKALDISETEYGWLTSAFSIAYLVSTPLAGWWIDRVGARRGLVGSVLVWSAVAAMHALVPGFGVLFALRIALGIAEGPSFPGSAQTVQRVLPPNERARGFGVLFTGSSIGGMMVPPLAAFLYSLGGWRIAFLGTALIGLLWVPLWLWATRRAVVRARLDAPPGVINAPRPPFMVLARHPLMVRAFVAMMAVAPAVGFLQAWGAKYLVRTHELLQEDVGAYLWLPPLGLDVGAILFGDLASRQHREGAPPRALFAIGALLCASIGLLPYCTTPWQAMIVLSTSMAGGGAIYTLVTADFLGRMPASSVSFAGGILAGAQSLMLIIVNPLIGKVVDAQGHYDSVAYALGAWVIPGCVIWLLWPPAPYVPGRQA